MKTRILTLIMALALIISLTACGGNDASGNTEDSGVKEIPLDKEVILVDNENVTIIATAKYEDPMTNFTF